MKKKNNVHVVHCVDTEGPLYESLASTFQRIYEIYGIKLTPTLENIYKLQNQELDLKGLESEISKIISPDLLSYKNDWSSVDEMLLEIMSSDFRKKHVDSFGSGWVYNWHCLDHVGFEVNPRRRDMGFHNIFDHYMNMIELTDSFKDGVHFHHHPVGFSREAHRCATHFFSHDPIIFQILSRRIIDRLWFPSSFRAGFHAERPDSHWFLEQFIPFDFSNQSTDEDYSRQLDLASGRFGDWRMAPKTWSPYHPAHDNYQEMGACRRWIARCLNVGTRLRLLTEQDVRQAFSEASLGKPVVLAFTNHDFRDMRNDISRTHNLIKKVSTNYPDVTFSYCEAKEAMQNALELPNLENFTFNIEISRNRLDISSSQKTFGPQPFFAIKTKNKKYFHDNLDFQTPFRSWSYTFDEHSICLDGIESIGVAACNLNGSVAVSVLNISTGAVKNKSY
jgi:hypothetical protein